MSRPFRLSAVLSAAVTAALAGALLSAPTTAYAESYAAAKPKASHVKACKKAGFPGASRMLLQSSKKAVGKSGKTKATARAWVYTSKGDQACVVTAANSPKVKKTKKTTGVGYSGYSAVPSDVVVRFEEGHVFNMPDIWGFEDYFSVQDRKAPKNLTAQVVELSADDVMTEKDLADFPKGMRSLKGQRYTLGASTLGVRWDLEGTRTLKVKKVKKAKALKTRKAQYKKIAKQRKAGLKAANVTWKKWVAAQPQTTAEERAWVEFWSGTLLELQKAIVKGEAKGARYAAKQTAKDARKGIKTQTVYDIKIDMPLALPKS